MDEESETHTIAYGFHSRNPLSFQIINCGLYRIIVSNSSEYGDKYSACCRQIECSAKGLVFIASLKPVAGALNALQ